MTSDRDHSPGQNGRAATLRAVAAASPAVAEPLAPVGDRGARARKARSGGSDDHAPAGDGMVVAARPAAPESAPTTDLRAPELYLTRELTWLEFNRRVLHEARDPRTPLLERAKFLAIVNSNLDEFFMKRIGGLKQQVGAGLHSLTVDGRTPEQQIAECVAVIKQLTPELRATYDELRGALDEQGIALLSWEQLSDEQRQSVQTFYLDNIFPLVTPLAMDPAHPFPFISNLSLNLLVTLRHQDDQQPVFARVKVPVGKGVARFLRVGAGHAFVPLEEVMAHSLDRLFPGMEIERYEFFRVTRNANTERDEEDADDLVSMIEAELRDRKFAPIVRVEVGEGIDPVHRGMLAAELGLDESQDVFESKGPLGLRDLFEIATLDLPALHDPVHHPVTNAVLEDSRNIFHIIRETGPILLQHPYESFATSVERFVGDASRDPKVLAIKMTLYRTSAGTGIIDALVEAARNGKQVAVVVEIKARFDEAANIQWA
ncbi:MAG TPA: polyphosphate kinase, partial [Kofleriaceae bacterium]|nr:polyphosphate kinase [Kofleriaceae bacterium]